MKNRVVLITGASSGIGEATARNLSKGPYELILCARRSDRLESLRNDLESHGTKVLVRTCDVRSEDSCRSLIEGLPKEWSKIDVLINNAGLAAGKDEIHEARLADWEQMIDTNVKGLLYMSRLVSRKMIASGTGHIVNVSSIAGKETYPGGSVYCGSKHAVEAITTTMRKELVSKGIKVSMVSPGLVNTEFSNVRFKGDMEKADNTYQGMTPLFGEDIASAIRYIIDAPAHVNIADILILPSAQASSTIVHRT